MKKYIAMILSLFALNYGSAQVNLVPNGDFEIHSLCPNMLGQIDRAVPWSDTMCSSDYYNVCGTPWLHVPDNVSGYQSPHSGDGYGGTILYHGQSPDVREYLYVKLTDSLKQGKKYCLSFFVSLAGGSKYAINNIGGLVSDSVMPPSCFFCPSGSVPNINYSSVISDTTNWTNVMGMFVATGGEEYLTIGNFYTDSQTSVTIINNQGFVGSYYYVDDVSIYELQEPFSGIDTTICKGDSIQLGDSTKSGIVYQWQPAIGLSDATIANPIAYPQTTTIYTLTISDTASQHCSYMATDTVTITVNDCTPPVIFYVPTILTGGQVLNISGLPPNSKFTLYNGLGQLLLEQENYSNQFNAADVAAGCYFYELEIPGENRQQGKICVVH